jgi:hypothetical protein
MSLKATKAMGRGNKGGKQHNDPKVSSNALQPTRKEVRMAMNTRETRIFALRINTSQEYMNDLYTKM